MAHSYEEIRQLAQELPAEQQILLANTLWESAVGDDDGEEVEIAAAWEAEIARRVAEIKTGTAATSTPEEVAADLRAIAGE
jgi:putative addiction module component (TIGR02574 family)